MTPRWPRPATARPGPRALADRSGRGPVADGKLEEPAMGNVRPDERSGHGGPAAADVVPGAAGRGAAAGERLAGVARGGALNLVGAAVSAAAALAATVLITRNFTKPVAGAFFTAISVFLIFETVASLGANVGAVNFIARLRSRGQEERIRVILRAAVIPVAVASVAAATLMLLAAAPLAHALPRERGANPAAVAQALRALALAIPFAALLDTFLGASRGFRDMRPTVLVDRLGRSAGQLFGVLAAVTAGSAVLLAPLWALPYAPAAAVAWLWLRRIRRRSSSIRAIASAVPPPRGARTQPVVAARTPAHRSGGGGRHARKRADKRLAEANPRAFWRFTAPRALASLAQITIQRIDIVLVAVLRGPAAAAVYTAATRFLVAGQLGNSAINMAAQPRFAELFAVGDRRSANVIYQATTSWLILLTWPLYLLAVIYGPMVLTVFGRSYRAGDTVMVILGCAMLMATACGQVDTVLITTGRSGWSLCNGLMAVVVNVGLDLLLIPRYGITGAAIGWAAAIAVTNLTPLAQIAVSVGLHPFGRGTLIACALTTVSFGAVPLAARALLGRGATVSVAAVGVGCVLLAAGLWWFRGALKLPAMTGMAFAGRRSRARAAAR